MLDLVKNFVAAYTVHFKIRKKKNSSLIPFGGFLKGSRDIFMIMPEDDADFTSSLPVIQFIEENKKNFVLFIRDFKVSSLPAKYRNRVLEYGIDSITKIDLPNSRITAKLEKMKFSAAIDLNRKSNLFSSYALNIVDSPVRVGFKKPDSDRYYNVQVINNSDIPEISYKNFLNCLQMF